MQPSSTLQLVYSAITHFGIYHQNSSTLIISRKNVSTQVLPWWTFCYYMLHFIWLLDFRGMLIRSMFINLCYSGAWCIVVTLSVSSHFATVPLRSYAITYQGFLFCQTSASTWTTTRKSQSVFKLSKTSILTALLRRSWLKNQYKPLLFYSCRESLRQPGAPDLICSNAVEC